ncbi:hypothetical protein FRC03_008748 [Tulasnella sp. 419]|nr:hypothetical protein FRC03_008748 [Tulasnella sp. 419]
MALVLGAALLGVGALIAVPPLLIGLVHALGWGAAGVVGGSFAALIQTPFTAAGSLFAILQSVGATSATIGVGGILQAIAGVSMGIGGVFAALFGA